jgi:hypothetical protein
MSYVQPPGDPRQERHPTILSIYSAHQEENAKTRENLVGQIGLLAWG